MIEKNKVEKTTKKNKEVKKVKVEKNSEEKKEIIVDPNLPFYKFRIHEMTVKTIAELGRRTAKFIIEEKLENAARNYNVILTFDSSVLDDQIRQVNDEKIQYESQLQSQIGEIQEENLKAFDERVKLLKEQREEAEKSCPKITFKMRVLVPDMKSSNFTVLLCKIPKNIANLLNDHWDDIGNYKIQLQEV